jgi:hypothetical protein
MSVSSALNSIFPSLVLFVLRMFIDKQPVTVVARSEAWTAFARSDAGIVGSNPTQDMDVSCVYGFILCLCRPVFR